MPNVVLVVFESDDPSNETEINFKPDRPPQPFLTGDGDVNLLCGDCGFMIAEKLTSASQIGQMAISCPRCGKYNTTRS